jgi:hypothetical protein
VVRGQELTPDVWRPAAARGEGIRRVIAGEVGAREMLQEAQRVDQTVAAGAAAAARPPAIVLLDLLDRDISAAAV